MYGKVFDGLPNRLIGPRHYSPRSLPRPEGDIDRTRRSYIFINRPRGTYCTVSFFLFALLSLRGVGLAFICVRLCAFCSECSCYVFPPKKGLPYNYLQYPCWNICGCGKRSCPLPALAMVGRLGENIVHACSESTNKQRRSQTVCLSTLLYLQEKVSTVTLF